MLKRDTVQNDCELHRVVSLLGSIIEMTKSGAQQAEARRFVWRRPAKLLHGRRGTPIRGRVPPVIPGACQGAARPRLLARVLRRMPPAPDHRCQGRH